MMLDWLGRRDGKNSYVRAGRDIDAAVDEVVADPARRTRDLGGTLTTEEATNAVLAALASSTPSGTTESETH